MLTATLALAPVVAFAGPPADVMQAPVPAGYYAFQKVVYQNDGGGPDAAAYFKRLLHNLENHLQAVDGKVAIRVVSFGPGVQLFQLARTDPELAAGLDRVRKAGVRFLVCRNTLIGMRLTPADLYHVADGDVVPSGVAEVARLQGLGYVYEHP
ncbi:MAG: DsrE family protein [Caulobacteraceae bacterium]|nr:DsrE family protein [Caulobacter sp.]